MSFTSSLPIWIPFISFVCLLWLGLPILCWIKAVRVVILVLFQIFMGRLSAFLHWVLYWLWVCRKWLFIMLRYVPYIHTLLRGFLFCFVLFFVFLPFLGPLPQHMEVPRLGVESELCCWPTPEPQQRGIWATSVTYTPAQGNARSLTHWARPGIKPITSWFLVGFVNHWATRRTPSVLFFLPRF